MSPPPSPPPPSPPPPHAYKFTSKDELKTAVIQFNENKTSAEATYGFIASWDVSGISDMSYLFSPYNSDYEPYSNSSSSNYSNSTRSSDSSYSYGYGEDETEETFDANISNWDTSGVTDMSGMFAVRCGPPPGNTPHSA